MKEFSGRVISSKEWRGEAVVSTKPVNTMATYYMSAYKRSKNIVAGDENNKELYGKSLTGKALCLPRSSSSTNTGLIIQTICDMGISPAAYLFSEHIDSMSASGIVLAHIWQDNDCICIDELGEEFLNYVKTGDEIEIKANGQVLVKKANKE